MPENLIVAGTSAAKHSAGPLSGHPGAHPAPHSSAHLLAQQSLHSGAPVAAQSAAANRRHPRAITILLVDDDPDCRLLVRDAIADSKVSNSIFEVTDGQEAIDFLQRRGQWHNAPRPGLIYMDIEMPNVNGIEALKHIKADPDLRDIPIVMMTGVSDESQMRAAAEAGANSYTIKPANATQFLKTVLASTTYWLTIHQYPDHHLPASECRR